MRRLESDTILMIGCLAQAAGCAWGPAATLPLEPNTRLRVRHHSSSDAFATRPGIEGSFVRTGRDTIVLMVDGTQEEWFVPLRMIDQLEVRQRRSNAAVGAGVGAAVGFALGAIVGFGTGLFCEYGGSYDCRTTSALIIGPIAGAGGAVLGGLIGAWIPAAERWWPMPLEPARLPGSRRNGAVDVGFRLPF